MSGVSIYVPGAPFPDFVSMLPPNLEKSFGLFLLGGTAAESCKNHAGGADLSVLGVPGYGDGFVALSPTAGFEGVTARTSPFTLMGVFSVGTGNGRYMGYSSDGAAGSSLHRNNTTLTGVLTGNSRVTTAAGTWAGSSFRFVSLSHDGATASIHIGAAETLTETSAPYAATPVANALRIGALGGVATSFGAALVQSAQLLSDAEIAESYEYARFICGKRGIVVS